MATSYDKIVEPYHQLYTSPKQVNILPHCYLNLIGDLSNKSVLDLGCGEGFFTRKFKQKGAAKVVGVDLSQGLLAVARNQESQDRLGIEYLVNDIFDLGKIGTFDLVVASYVLNHARSPEQLLKICETIYANLKPSGRFIAINNNVQQSPKTYGICEKYGFQKIISEPMKAGTAIVLKIQVEGQEMEIEDYYLSKETYEWAFRTAGLKSMRWHKLSFPTQESHNLDREFWQDFFDYNLYIGIECQK